MGGSHGIGLGIVRRLVESGHQVTVLSRTTGDLGDLTASVRHVVCDVTDGIAADAMPDSIDGLAYCPGSINLGPIRGVKPETMRSDFDLNVVGAMLSLQAALKGLKSAKGSVVFFSTVAVAQGMQMHASVASVKGAVEGLTRSAAAELAPNVRVNALAPALVDTPLAERLLSSDDKRAAMDRRHPLGRIGTVDDLAAAAVYLLGRESSWITGQVIGVDGGLSTLRTG